MSFKTTATIASFGGKLLKLTHDASTTGCEMALNLYLPPNAGATSQKVPVLFYLSGLTCTGDNCAEKGFFQYGASQKGIAVVYPDTSPRTSPNSPFPLPEMWTDNSHRRTQNPRRRRQLRFRLRRWVLHRRNCISLVQELQNGIIHYIRAPQSTLLFIPRARFLESFYHRS